MKIASMEQKNEPYIPLDSQKARFVWKGGDVMHDFLLSQEQAQQLAFDWHDIIIADIKAEEEYRKEDSLREEHTDIS